jgi:hypothetical protein
MIGVQCMSKSERVGKNGGGYKGGVKMLFRKAIELAILRKSERASECKRRPTRTMPTAIQTRMFMAATRAMMPITGNGTLRIPLSRA